MAGRANKLGPREGGPLDHTPQMNKVLLIELRNCLISNIKIKTGDEWQEPEEARIQNGQFDLALVSSLISRFSINYLTWLDAGLLPGIEQSIEKWPDFLSHKLEILHLGFLHRPGTELSSFGYCAFATSFIKDPGNINKEPTWAISPLGGIMHAGLWQALLIPSQTHNFRLLLLEAGFKLHTEGALIYSHPGLVAESERNRKRIELPILKNREVIGLLGNTLKSQWMYYWILAKVLFERQFPGLDSLASLIKSEGNRLRIDMAQINSLRPEYLADRNLDDETIDVIIPTLKRKEYLYNVLEDIGAQTHLPNQVIIIEQSEDPASELDFLQNRWPFEIRHILTSQVGACQARNRGIELAKSKWIYFLDDDIKLRERLFEECIRICKNYQIKALTQSVYLPGQRVNPVPLKPWDRFGTCSSIVSTEIAKKCRFDLQFEFGYGEDADFGDQLRSQGTHILYDSTLPILHYKAPSGGFRFTFKKEWDSESIPPKPSPTIMYYYLKNRNPWQRKGYKLFYFINRMSKARGLKKLAEFKLIKQQWATSQRWGELLLNRSSSSLRGLLSF